MGSWRTATLEKACSSWARSSASIIRWKSASAGGARPSLRRMMRKLAMLPQYPLAQKDGTSDGQEGPSARSVVRRDGGPSQGPRDDVRWSFMAALRVAFPALWRASAALADGPASPARCFLPRGPAKRSDVPSFCARGYWFVSSRWPRGEQANDARTLVMVAPLRQSRDPRRITR